MAYKILADAVLIFHFCWILAVVLGPLLCWKRPRWRLVHLAVTAIPLGFMIFTNSCPLTGIENALLSKSTPPANYYGGFLAHHLGKLIYWNVPPLAVTIATSAWLAAWGLVYAYLRRKETRRKPLT